MYSALSSTSDEAFIQAEHIFFSVCGYKFHLLSCLTLIMLVSSWFFHWVLPIKDINLSLVRFDATFSNMWTLSCFFCVVLFCFLLGGHQELC